MRPDRDTLTVESTLQGEDVRMRIAEGAEAHIMSILTDMYEKRVRAQCREYGTNAWDSHVEAGNTAPIEVTTPSALRPVFSVRDFGVGLDAEGIRRIYSQYGASTKRETDEQTGMLGIGCKAALTYTDQFTVVGVKDGVKTIVSVSRDEDGAATMKILSAEPTTDNPGVEVQIPCKRDDISEFQKEAAWVFKFWQPGTVLLNGADPSGLGDTAYRLTDSITVVEDEDTDFLVMGNVAYPTDLGIYPASSWRSSKHIIAEVGIGALSFTPSRESLMDTARTQKCIESVRAEFTAAAKLAVQRDVDAASSKAEALTAYMKATQVLPAAAQPDPDQVTYQGDKLPDFPAVTHSNTVTNAGGKWNDSNAAPQLSEIERGIWLTEYDNEKFTKPQREKLIAYIESEHTSLDEVRRRPLFRIPMSTVPHAEWVPSENVISWSDVRKWQPPLQPGQAVPTYKRTGIYYGFRPGSNYVQDVDAKEIPTDKRIYWKQARKYHGGRDQKALVAALDSDQFWFIVLPENRVKKFVKDFPKAIEVGAFMKEKATKRRANLPAEVVEAAHFDDPGYELDELDAAKVDDPALKKAIGIAKAARKHYTLIGQLSREEINYGLDPLPGGPAPEIQTVTDRYPLLRSIEHYGDRLPKDDLYLYINAAYAARQ